MKQHGMLQEKPWTRNLCLLWTCCCNQQCSALLMLVKNHGKVSPTPGTFCLTKHIKSLTEFGQTQFVRSAPYLIGWDPKDCFLNASKISNTTKTSNLGDLAKISQMASTAQEDAAPTLTQCETSRNFFNYTTGFVIELLTSRRIATQWLARCWQWRIIVFHTQSYLTNLACI